MPGTSPSVCRALLAIEGLSRMPGGGWLPGALLVATAVAVAAALFAPTARRWVR